MDDTFSMLDSNDVEPFKEHLNSKCLEFTHELEKDGQLPFLDVLVKRSGNSFSTSVYRKGTHTDQYLQFDSDHPLLTKIGVAKTLLHRAKEISFDTSSLEQEKSKVWDSLTNCGYPKRALKEALKPCPTDPVMRTLNPKASSPFPMLMVCPRPSEESVQRRVSG